MTKLEYYLMAVLAALVGCLVILLHIQGGRIHSLQLDLLLAKYASAEHKDEAVRTQLWQAFEKAVAEYEEAM